MEGVAFEKKEKRKAHNGDLVTVEFFFHVPLVENMRNTTNFKQNFDL